MAYRSHLAICEPLFRVGMSVQAFDADWLGTITEIRASRSGDPIYRIAFSDYISSWVRQSSITPVPVPCHAGNGHAASGNTLCAPTIATPAMACIPGGIASYPPIADCAMEL